MGEASSLRGLGIVPAIEAAMGGIMKNSAVVTCWHMASPGATSPHPRVDLILRGVPILTDRSGRCKMREVVETFGFQFPTLERIYLLCDRYAEGIEPPPGVTWDEDTRTKCVKVSLMACLTMLFRSADTRTLLTSNPKILVVGMLQGNEVSILSDESERMIHFADQNLPSN